MKKYFIFLLAFISCYVFAQQKQGRVSRPLIFSYGLAKPTIVGKSNIRIRYAFQAYDLSDESTWIDCGQLLVNDSIVQYSSYFLDQHVEALKKWKSEHPNAGYYPNSINLKGRGKYYWSEYQYSQISIHANTLTEWAVMPLTEFQQWRYTEPYPSMSWNLCADTLSICGYLCQKANCHWRGRDYEAWFALQIPLKVGPWKFGGLPGVIMRIYDTGHLYTWEAVAVERGNFPISLLDKRYFKETTRNKVWGMQRDYNIKYNELAGRIKGSTGLPITTRYSYEQLELE